MTKKEALEIISNPIIHQSYMVERAKGFLEANALAEKILVKGLEKIVSVKCEGNEKSHGDCEVLMDQIAFNALCAWREANGE